MEDPSLGIYQAERIVVQLIYHLILADKLNG